MPPYQRKVTPNSARPRLAAKREEQLAPVDEASARSYDELEASREQLQAAGRQADELVESLRGGTVQAELEVTESLVHVFARPAPAKPPAPSPIPEPSAKEPKPRR